MHEESLGDTEQAGKHCLICGTIASVPGLYCFKCGKPYKKWCPRCGKWLDSGMSVTGRGADIDEDGGPFPSGEVYDYNVTEELTFCPYCRTELQEKPPPHE
jgi:hypothetical protein